MADFKYETMNRMTSVNGLDGDITRNTYDAGRRVETTSNTLSTFFFPPVRFHFTMHPNRKRKKSRKTLAFFLHLWYINKWHILALRRDAAP